MILNNILALNCTSLDFILVTAQRQLWSGFYLILGLGHEETLCPAMTDRLQNFLQRLHRVLH